MTNENHKSRLDKLNSDIDNLREDTRSVWDKEPKEKRANPMRFAIELVSGVAVGGFSGYWLDKWLDTSPIFLIICFFLGVAAGAFNIYKLAAVSEQTADDRQQ